VSGGSAALVDQATQYGFSVDSLDIEVDCRSAGSVAVTAGKSLGNALMRPGRIVVDLILDQHGAQVRLAEDQNAVEELAAQVPMRRSQVAFIRGARTAVRKILVPTAWKKASKDWVKFDPRSRIRNRNLSTPPPRVSARLRARCTVHSPVGFAVTPRGASGGCRAR